MDGSPAVRSERAMGWRSPGRRWVVSWPSHSSEEFVLLPPARQPRPLPHAGIASTHNRAVLPDGGASCFRGERAPGRCASTPRTSRGAITPRLAGRRPDGPVAISPDGRLLAAPGPDQKIAIYPVDGSEPRPLPARSPGETRFSGALTAARLRLQGKRSARPGVQDRRRDGAAGTLEDDSSRGSHRLVAIDTS